MCMDGLGPILPEPPRGLHARQYARGDQAIRSATMACDRVPHRRAVPHTLAGQSSICGSADACQNWAFCITHLVSRLRLQLLQQRLGLLEVSRVKALREPAVDG